MKLDFDVVRLTAVGLAVVTWLPGTALAQGSGYSPPRTSHRHPNLQGIWGSNSITPLERPAVLGEKTTLTSEELARVEATADALFALDAGDAAFGDQFFNVAISEAESFTSSDGGTGNYNQFWLVERNFNNRTSLITDLLMGNSHQLPQPRGRLRTWRALDEGGPRCGPMTVD